MKVHSTQSIDEVNTMRQTSIIDRNMDIENKILAKFSEIRKRKQGTRSN